jgi:hypothetical protein
MVSPAPVSPGRFVVATCNLACVGSGGGASDAYAHWHHLLACLFKRACAAARSWLLCVGVHVSTYGQGQHDHLLTPPHTHALRV